MAPSPLFYDRYGQCVESKNCFFSIVFSSSCMEEDVPHWRWTQRTKKSLTIKTTAINTKIEIAHTISMAVGASKCTTMIRNCEIFPKERPLPNEIFYICSHLRPISMTSTRIAISFQASEEWVFSHTHMPSDEMSAWIEYANERQKCRIIVIVEKYSHVNRSMLHRDKCSCQI